MRLLVLTKLFIAIACGGVGDAVEACSINRIMQSIVIIRIKGAAGIVLTTFVDTKGFRIIWSISHLGFYAGFAAVRMRGKTVLCHEIYSIIREVRCCGRAVSFCGMMVL